jgi:hypothetical protein
MKKPILSIASLVRVAFGVAALLIAKPVRVLAQAEPAGLGPGSYVQIGASFSDYQIDYGQRRLGGADAFIDAHLYRRIGAEAEVRMLRLNEDEGVHSTTYLIGPRVSFLAGRFRPYTKLLIGRGEFYFPFHSAEGSYFVIAPGGGVDWHLARTRITVRLVDIELQQWPGFSFGAIRPYGVSSGVALRVF